MFSSLQDSGPARARWRDGVRRAVELAVAFATLESYELPRRGPHGAVDESLRASRSADPAGAHPHRAPLRAPGRPRRPGRVAARVQPCTAVAPLPAPRERRRAPERAR